jgi:hypothetical protein
MTAATLAAPSRLGRLFRSLPIAGRVIRDVERDTDRVLYLGVILVTALVLAVQAWGLPALVLAALATVPEIFSLLIRITLP